MRNAIKYIYDANPLYVHWKRHLCPICKRQLKTHYRSTIVDSKSPEAANYDFSIGDTFLVGEVEFRKSCFYCPSCELDVSFKKMKEIERNTKKRG